jgi:ribonucleoside-diphosphate reductase alpha chain
MSEELGERKGSFPAIDKSIFSGPMRNATVTTIAPTGSLHLIANTSSGIEPIFSLSYKRQIGTTSVSVIHPLLKTCVQSLRSGIDILAEVRRTGTIAHLPVPDDVKELFRTAIEIAPDHHIDMQATFQRHVDNAVSKTVNLPETAGVDEIYRVFLRARRLGCKGVTVYRYNSKKDQVLSRGCETCRIDP